MTTSIHKKFNWKFLLILPIFALFMLGLSACSGSAKLEGTYYTEDSRGDQEKILITKDEITVRGRTYNYKQTSVGKKNGAIYYGVKFQDRTYTIIFPESGDGNVAIMMMTDGTEDNMLRGMMMFALNREEQPSFKDYYKKYMKQN